MHLEEVGCGRAEFCVDGWDFCFVDKLCIPWRIPLSISSFQSTNRFDLWLGRWHLSLGVLPLGDRDILQGCPFWYALHLCRFFLWLLARLHPLCGQRFSVGGGQGLGCPFLLCLCPVVLIACLEPHVVSLVCVEFWGCNLVGLQTTWLLFNRLFWSTSKRSSLHDLWGLLLVGRLLLGVVSNGSDFWSLLVVLFHICYSFVPVMFTCVRTASG